MTQIVTQPVVENEEVFTNAAQSILDYIESLPSQAPSASSVGSGSKPVFLVPRTLTWDKLCALVLHVYVYLGRFPAGIRQLINEGVLDVVFEDEDDRPAQFIDVDVVKDYKAMKCGSATRNVAVKKGLLAAGRLPGMENLAWMLDKNNKTGYLKSQPESLVALIREVFNVGAENPSRERRLKVIEVFWSAVTTYFGACAANDKAVWEQIEHENPFTLGSFRKLCAIAGMDVDQTQELTGKFAAAFSKGEKLREQAAVRAATIEPVTFIVPASGGQRDAVGHYIETDNIRIAKFYFAEHPEVAVLVIRRSIRCPDGIHRFEGNITIMCRGAQDFSALFAELDRRESDKWYLETRNTSPMLLNGSATRHRPASQLKRDELIVLIQQYHLHRSRSD